MNVRLQYPLNFTAGVYYDGELKMNNYTVKLWLITNTVDPDNHNICMDRIKYFFYDTLDSTIFINSELREQCLRYQTAGLKITTMPGEPVDQLIGIMLYYKLNAIMEERMTVMETETSSILGDSMIYMHGEHENTDGITAPNWWSTSDLVHCEYEIVNNDKIVDMHNASVWRDLNMAWPELDDVVTTGNTIVFADFKQDETK